jgi:dTMP kinase
MYIVLEGIDGSGKSTHSKLLKKWLEDIGVSVELVVEPTNSQVGHLIRKLLLNPHADDSEFQKKLGLLFATDRLFLKDKIESLEKNRILLSDRSYYSSLVYQEPQEWISKINKYAKKPDLVILLDVDEKTAMDRCSGTDGFENESFLKNTRKKYLDLAKKEDMIIVDATPGIRLVQHNLKKVLASHLGICVTSITQ